MTLTIEELGNYPHVVVQGLLQSLVKQDLPNIALFLPIYQKLPGADPAFSRWAQAVRAWHNGDYRAAIRDYRWLIAHYPQNELIRLQLAIALFENQDNDAAKDQFERLRSGALPPLLATQIDSYLTHLRHRDAWSFTGNLAWINERNINNAPPPGTQLRGWLPPKPEAASGLNYALQAQKTYSHSHGLFSEYRLAGNGNYFPRNASYDELSLRASAGGGYRDNDKRLLLLPFIERHWYGGGQNGDGGLQPYAHYYGLGIELQQRLNAHWLFFGSGEWAINRYHRKTYLNGNSYALAGNFIYYPSPGQYWFAGLNHQRQQRRFDDDSYKRYGARAGWGYEWPYGISSRIELSYARRGYQGRDIFGITQKNNEYSTLLTLWHRSIYFLGITPKISWLYQKTASNHPFYQYDKHKIFWHFSKDF